MTGDSESFQYDGNSGRMTQWSSIAGSNTQTGTLTWNANATLQRLVISDTYNSANSQTCNYSYDDVVRLVGANCGSIASTYSYDRFGNITKNGNWIFNQGYDTSTNHVLGFTYDGMGNVSNDGSYSYTYDAEGRPISISGVTTTFDAFGGRSRPTTAAPTRRSPTPRAASGWPT